MHQAFSFYFPRDRGGGLLTPSTNVHRSKYRRFLRPRRYFSPSTIIHHPLSLSHTLISPIPHPSTVIILRGRVIPRDPSFSSCQVPRSSFLINALWNRGELTVSLRAHVYCMCGCKSFQRVGVIACRVICQIDCYLYSNSALKERERENF